MVAIQVKLVQELFIFLYSPKKHTHPTISKYPATQCVAGYLFSGSPGSILVALTHFQEYIMKKSRLEYSQSALLGAVILTAIITSGVVYSSQLSKRAELENQISDMELLVSTLPFATTPSPGL